MWLSAVYIFIGLLEKLSKWSTHIIKIIFAQKQKMKKNHGLIFWKVCKFEVHIC